MPRDNGMPKAELALRKSIIEACRWMNDSGLNQGTSGNISARYRDTMVITPSGVPYEKLEPEDMAVMPIDSAEDTWTGPLNPSSEWRFHLDILRARPEVGAVVHTHSTFSTTLAIARKEIPACHYMIAAAGGPTIRCAEYATYGTEELSANALAAMEGRTCCLLANHGLIATGPNLEKAMWLAVEVETIARQYYYSLSIGGPVVLADDEIARVVEKFKNYGPRDKPGKDAEVAAGTKAKKTRKAKRA